MEQSTLTESLASYVPFLCVVAVVIGAVLRHRWGLAASCLCVVAALKLWSTIAYRLLHGQWPPLVWLFYGGPVLVWSCLAWAVLSRSNRLRWCALVLGCLQIMGTVLSTVISHGMCAKLNHYSLLRMYCANILTVLLALTTVSATLPAVAARALSFRGRSRRRTYWVAILSVTALNLGLLALWIAVNEDPSFATETRFVAFVAAIMLMVGIPSTWLSLAASVRRWHDAGYSSWMMLTLLIPVGNVFAPIILGCLPPSPRADRFGPDPRAT